MLTRLALRNFVLIDEAEIEFSDDFCALTGETGAGKSLLVGAIGLLAGARAAAGLTRSGNTAAEIEASFELKNSPQVLLWLEENNLDDDGKMIVRRVIADDSRKSRAFINGRLVPLSQMATGVSAMVEICGQHEHYSLLKSAAHRSLLDACATATADAAAVSVFYEQWRICHKALTDGEKNTAELTAKRDALRDDCEELAKLNFSDDKWEECNARLTRLANISDLAESCTEALMLLEGEGGASEKITAASRRVHSVLRHDKQLENIHSTLQETLQLGNEATRALSSYAEQLQPDREGEEEAEDFIAEAHRLARKYTISDPAQLGKCLQEKENALAALEKEADIATLRNAEKKARQELSAAAAKLSAKRKPAAKRLAAEILVLLKDLAMPHTRLEFELTTLEQTTAHGDESIAIKFATQDGAPLKNISEIASGGELSRLGLAVHIAAGKFSPRASVVFDEVDAGVGGATASVVGRLLQKLASTRQVLCVTHLAQVAAYADTHWQVKITKRGGKRLTDLHCLDDDQRIKEIARMSGGVKVSKQALAHAGSLRDEAKR